MNTQLLKESLQAGLVRVTFTKKDGVVRIIDCTKNLNLIPSSGWPKSEELYDKAEEHYIRAYDVNAKGWRSFLIQNVCDVQLL